MKTSTTISLAVVLLIGAGALVWWKALPFGASEPTPISSGEPVVNQSKNATAKLAKSRYIALTDHALAEQTRLDLARSIDTHLRPDELDFLLSILSDTPPSHGREQWWLILNEIMEQMRKKGVAPHRLGPALTDLVSDSQQSEVVRDYAIQHLSQWIAPPTADTPSETSSENKAAALAAIAATITDPSIASTSIPGTALMALTSNDSYLSEVLTAPIWKKLDPSLSTILKGETYGSMSTRTTIIQCVALRGSQIHLPMIREFARDEKVDSSIRLSSIAALGIYGSEDDRDYLQQISMGNTRYRHAAQSALKKLSK